MPDQAPLHRDDVIIETAASWRIALASMLIISVGWGAPYLIAVALKPMAAELGAARSGARDRREWTTDRRRVLAHGVPVYDRSRGLAYHALLVWRLCPCVRAGALSPASTPAARSRDRRAALSWLAGHRTPAGIRVQSCPGRFVRGNRLLLRANGAAAGSSGGVL